MDMFAGRDAGIGRGRFGAGGGRGDVLDFCGLIRWAVCVFYFDSCERGLDMPRWCLGIIGRNVGALEVGRRVR